jgi:hypothetical protein
MPRVAKGMKPLTVGLTPEMYAELTALANRLGRSIQVEAVCAIGRHLEAPPTLDEPALKPVAVRPGPAQASTPPVRAAPPAAAPRSSPAPARKARRQEDAERRTALDQADGISRVGLAEEGGCMGAET